MDYEQAFHDVEVTGAAEERRAIVTWLRRESHRYAVLRSVWASAASDTMAEAADAIDRGDHSALPEK